MSANSRGAASWLLTAAMLPPKLFEEAVHACACAPWARAVHVTVRRDGQAHCDVALDPDAPDWALLLTAWLPMVLGIAIGIGVVGWAATADVRPQSLNDWALLSVLTIWWGHFSLPSAADRERGRDIAAAEGAADD